MKTWKELIEALGMAQRKAIGRRMAMISKKKSTQIAKARNKLRPWSKKQVHTKAQKAVRKFLMQKIAGKGKDLSDMSIGQKEKLEKMVDKKMKGGKMNAFVKKKEKILAKQHKDDIKKAKEKKKEE